MILACSIDGWKFQMLDAVRRAARAYVAFAGELHEALVGVRARAGARRPRRRGRAAPTRRSMISSSGTKYAVVIRMRCCGELQQRAEQRGDVAVARSPTRRARTARRDCPAWVGRGSGRRRRRRARDRSRTSCRGTRRAARRRPDPRCGSACRATRARCAASPSHSSAMPTPPVKPIASSTIMHLAVGPVVDLVEPEPAQRPEPAHAARRRPPSRRPAAARSGARPRRRAARARARRLGAARRAPARTRVPISPSQ